MTEKEKIIEHRFHYDELLLRPIGDQHYGARIAVENKEVDLCDVNLFLEDLNFIENTENCRTLFMGDECDFAVQRSGKFHNLPSELQHRHMTDWLKKVANKSLGQLDSNHDHWIDREVGIKIAKIRAATIGVPFLGYQQTFKIWVKDIPYVIVAAHGWSGAITTQGKIKTILDQAKAYDGVEIVLMAHTHRLGIDYEIRKKILESEVKYLPTVVVGTGSYLRYKGSYAEKRGWPPQMLGSPLLKLSGSKKSVEVLCKFDL